MPNVLIPNDSGESHRETDQADWPIFVALGRLDGALQRLPADVRQLFLLLTIRRTLATALQGAGVPSTDDMLKSWIAGFGPPPPPTPHSAGSAQEIAAAVLTELLEWSWQPLAAAAQLFVQAAPHLMRYQPPSLQDRLSNDPMGFETGDAFHAVRVARETFARELSNDALRGDPLSAAIHQLSKADVMFGASLGETQLLEIHGSLRAIRAVSLRTHSWALGLYLGQVLAQLGTIRLPLPFAASVIPRTFDTTGSFHARRLALRDGLGQDCAGLFEDLEFAYSLDERLRSELTNVRSTSRAPEAFTVIAGLGFSSRAQLMRACNLSAAGASEVLNKLRVGGLVERVVGRSGLYRVGSPTTVATARSVEDSGLTATSVETFSAALAELDHLLSKTNVSTGPPGSE